MSYLFLAVGSCTLISLIIRYSERHIQNFMVMYAMNYAICLLCAGIFMEKSFRTFNEKGLRIAMMLGLCNGLVYLNNIVFTQKNIQYNGIGLSTIFMRLGMILPILMTIGAFHEWPRILPLIGMVAAIISVVVICVENGILERRKANGNCLLIALLLSSGIMDCITSLYDRFGTSEHRDYYLFFVFLSALACSIWRIIKEKQRIEAKEIGLGSLIGVSNYFTSRFLLLALEQIPAMIVYPVYSISLILLSNVIGRVLFQEHLGKMRKAALGLIMIALVLLNV